MNDDELKNIINWIKFYEIRKINIHGYIGYEQQSYEFFMNIFDKLKKE